VSDPIFGPGAAVVVLTIKDVYDVAQETRSIVTGMAHRIETAEARHMDHEARIRALERARWPLPALSVLIALASATLAAVALLTP